MLRQLVIRDVVLIDRLTLDFGDGLGVLTGETGAGKSILLDSLGLALGMRADSGLVRAGQEAASVTAAFDVNAGHPSLALLNDAGIEQEAGEPLIFLADVPGFMINDGVWLGEGAEISPDAIVVGPVVVGPGCKVEAGCRLGEYTASRYRAFAR